jgi:hypothetical protein
LGFQLGTKGTHSNRGVGDRNTAKKNKEVAVTRDEKNNMDPKIMVNWWSKRQ